MPFGESDLGSFGSLTRAIGLTTTAGTNAAWFGDPVGGSTANPTGLKTVLSNDGQLTALLAFVDEVLGPPAAHSDGPARWVPLFAESDPSVTLYAVVEPVAGAVRVGVGVEHTTGGTATTVPRVSTRLHVPLVHVPRGGSDSRPTGGTTPRWLLLGRAGGAVRVEVDATFTDAAPVPREPFLRGAAVSVGIPTDGVSPVEFALELCDLQLPGAANPQTQSLTLDDLDAVGADVLAFVVGLVRAQLAALDLTSPALRSLAGLAGALGLRDGVAGLPPLPVGDLPSRGVAALVDWVETVLTDDTARDAWLGQLEDLTGGTALPDRDAVQLDLGDAELTVGLRVTPGSGGHPVLVPWVEASWETTAGAAVRAAVDLLRLDTATGAAAAVPALRLEAVLGADAPGGSALLTTGPVRIGSVHVGAAHLAATGPALVLELHDTVVNGHPHAVLDLSSPEAALDAADDVLDAAIADALDALGDAGELLASLLGVRAPAGVTGPGIVELVSDPLGALRGYWRALLASDAAMGAVLTDVAHLLTGAAPAALPGLGTAAAPWRVDLAEGAGLRVWREDATLAVGLGVHAGSPALGTASGLRAAVDAALVLVRADLAAGTVAFLPAATGRATLEPTGDGPARLELGGGGPSGATLELGGLGVEVGWAAGHGLTARTVGAGLALLLPDPTAPAVPTRLAVPLPILRPDGTVDLGAGWDDVERLLGALVARLDVPFLDAVLELLGWHPGRPGGALGVGASARLRLGDLVADPPAALAAWATSLALDCGALRAALGPVAWLLSGGRLSAPLGVGDAERPHRCPVAGEPAAPGLVAWTVPPCPPPAPRSLGGVAGPDSLLGGTAVADGAALAGALRLAADGTPSVADLLVARPGLADGLDTLLARWAGTDGVTAPPASMPADVGLTVLDGFGYAELVASARAGTFALDELVDPPAAVVHVGCDPGWLEGGRGGTTTVDATGPIPPPLPATGDGPWHVLVPTPAAGDAARPDRDGVRAQAEAVVAVLAARTQPVLLVGHGGAGAAVLRAATLLPNPATVPQVATVGTPWSATATAALHTGRGGDALRLLGALLPADPPAWADEDLATTTSPQRRGIDLVRRSLAVTGPGDLPSAAAEARRPGLTVHAVLGTLEATDVAAAVAAVVSTGLAERAAADAAAAAPAAGPPRELHLGLDLPVLFGDVGGLTLGAGATVELLAVHADAPALRPLRSVGVTLRLGVTDGWLVGGPGAPSRDLELRWLDVRVDVPFDGRPGDAQLVLHEARAFTAYRESWVVRAGGDGVTATTALPEVRALLGEVVVRLRTAAPDLLGLLTALGVARAGGLDPGGLDRLLFDPAATVRAAVTAAPADLAALLRGLIGTATDDAAAPTLPALPALPAPPPTVVRLGPAGATVDLDLAAGTVTGSLALDEPGLPPLQVALTAGASGATVDLALGALDPAAGGLRLVARLAAGGPTVRLVHAAPGGPVVPVALHPAPTATDLEGLAAALAPAVPAALLRVLVDELRRRAAGAGAAALEAALDAVGLLAPAAANGARAAVLPYGLLADPLGWLRARTDPLAAAVAVLDALALVVAPDRGAGSGWPVTDELTVTYAVSAGRLALAAALRVDTTVDGRPVGLGVTAGLDVGTTGAPALTVGAGLAVDGYGAELTVGGALAGSGPAGGPAVRLDLLRPAPASRLPLYPAGAGVGSALEAGAESLVVLAANALLDRRTGPAGAARSAGEALHELCTGLGLLGGDGHVDPALLAAFVDHPGDTLLARLPDVATRGLGQLVAALDPAGTVVRTRVLPSGARRLAFGASGTDGVVHVDLDGAARALAVGVDVDLGTWGHLALDELRVSAAGVTVGVRAGPFTVDLGGIVLRPLVLVRAGVASGAVTRMVGLGVAVDEDGTESVLLRWGLDASPPELVAEPAVVPADPAAVAARLLGVAVSIASGLVTEQLGSVVTARATAMLQDVVFTGGGRTVDPGFVAALADPDALLDRLRTLAWNAATAATPLSLTIEDTVTIGLAAESAGGARQRLGLVVSLVPGRRLNLATGSVSVDLEVDADWITGDLEPGLSVFVLEGTRAALDLVPGVAVAGLGLRFSSSAGPLLELGSVSLDAIAVNLYGEATSSGVGGGVRLQLDGLAVAPGGGAGGNGVANALMNDVGSSRANSRPAFSPSLAVQKHPGEALGVSLRAGDPPGPWWVVIQRQLGPLYVDRIGLDVVEADRRVTRISLLFTGQVSLFGLQAAVDRLSLSWNGGDVLSITSWSVDFMGLAVSADLAGVSLAGGLVKTVEGSAVSYVGMLVGRFAAYGLSVFGGYTNDSGHASFFVFGGVTGPIGGPPAFFLTGIGGGLGINRGLVVPDDLSRFGDYPFIQALDPAARPPDDPMDRLHELAAYFPHAMGNFWFAAGISFTCFSLVDGIAVVAVAFGDGLEVNLFGLARMALPRPGAALVSIELALLARFSTREGVFMIRAQLTDNSWLLYEDVRLTGGFAFAVWWKGPLRGQFVLTMGGYHPDFEVPAGYPDVPRLGLVWRISDVLVVKGGSYFALTSEALMAGTDVEVSLDLGWVWARVAFGAHGIVYFDPFWFEVMAYARISAGIDIDLGLFSISLSVTIGAQVKVWGPDFAGEARFEIGPCEIPVSFGSPRKVAPATLDWPTFVGKYLEDAGGGRARALSSITGRGTLPTSTGGRTGAPSADGTLALPFQVFAEFEVSFTTTVPVTSVDVGLDEALRPPVTLSTGATTGLGLAPSGAGGLVSALLVRLEKQREDTGTWEARFVELHRLGRNFTRGTPDPAGSRVEQDSFPLGVWGPPKSLGTTAAPLPSTDVVSAGARLTLVAEVDSMTVGPQIDYYRVEAARRPLPLAATGATRRAFLTTSRDLGVTQPVTVTEALEVARATLYPADPTTGAAVRGSALGRAAYVRDRSAPPTFGLLTDGLAAAGGEDGAREVLEAPVREVPEPRLPFVTAHLTGGAGAVLRAATTSVGDRRLKRRPAPTVESVRGRLGVRLPVTLECTAPPAVAAAGTVVAVGGPPRTDVPGATTSYAGARAGSPTLQALVAGLGGRAGLPPRAAGERGARPGRAARAREEALAGSVRSGDVVVLQCPDGQRDVDPQRRPRLVLDGPGRVVAVAGRTVLLDEDAGGTPGGGAAGPAVPAGTVVPPGTTLLLVHAGGDADATDGSPGWHDRSRVARAGTHVGVAAGCTVSVDAAGAAPTMSWGSAGDLVADAREVVTRFTGPVTTVAVAVTGVAPKGLDPAVLGLRGAEVATDRTGAPVPPVAVVLGPTTVLVHAIVPEQGAVVTVVVRSGGDWEVTAVVGSATERPDDLAARIAREGLAAVTAKVLAVAGPGVGLRWEPAPRPPRRARRSRKDPT